MARFINPFTDVGFKRILGQVKKWLYVLKNMQTFGNIKQKLIVT